MKAARFNDLPLERRCNTCGKTKPRDEMIIQHRKSEGIYYFRPKCKDCHNTKERGNRREYKTKYLQAWRKKNAAVNKSYWKDDPGVREAARVRAANRSRAEIDAIAIQRRLRHQGEYITIAEARELLALYGRCYPTKHGLTRKGQQECERIRSRVRARTISRRMPSSFEIRVMVYEESAETPGLLIPPDQQPVPYQANADNLRKWWARQRPTAIGATA